ncbi:MAG: hypothetical protein ACI8RZ_003997 [Myxococcota bacterium]|jgi:hypothetical protein
MSCFGIGFLFIPVLVFSLYGVTLEASGLMLAHVSGAAVFTLGVLAWLFRSHETGPAIRSVAQALFVFFVLKTIVTLLAQLGGVFNAMGWSIVILDALFVLGYGHTLFFTERLTAIRSTPAAPRLTSQSWQIGPSDSK